MPRYAIKVSLVAVAAFAAGVTVGPTQQGGGAAGSTDTFRSLKLFGDVFERVRAEYVEEVGDQVLIETAINGMLASLDPHSSYLDAEKYRDMQVQTRGEFGGLGIEVTMENGLVKVVSPIDDTPAFRAGIESGDMITHIDGEPVMGLTPERSRRAHARAGRFARSPCVSCGRAPRSRSTSALNRAVIKISPVRARSEGDVGYLRLTTFNEQTSSALRDKVEELKGQSDNKIRGLVLDLRNNPGGLLDQAVAVADAFLDKGEIVSTRGRRSDSIQRFNARPGDLLDNLPIVVLINGGSASASEIVAGALQDHRRAIVMGTQSFGKGSVQTIMPISGQGAIRLTTARYYTPAGTSIQAKGITPDIEVHQASVQLLDDTNGRREADLRGRLENDQAAKDAGGSQCRDGGRQGLPAGAGRRSAAWHRALRGPHGCRLSRLTRSWLWRPRLGCVAVAGTHETVRLVRLDFLWLPLWRYWPAYSPLASCRGAGSIMSIYRRCSCRSGIDGAQKRGRRIGIAMLAAREPAREIGLPAPVDAALVETAAVGTLPRIAADGRTSLRQYAHPSAPGCDRPCVGLIITGLGLATELTTRALALPWWDCRFLPTPMPPDGRRGRVARVTRCCSICRCSRRATRRMTVARSPWRHRPPGCSRP